MPDSLRDRWDGDAWRWWALGAGAALAAAAVGAGLAASLVIPGSWSTLILAGLLAELCAIGIVGSGMFEGLSSRAIAGGMARQPLPERRRGSRNLSEAERLRRDRKTIRAGLMTLPVLAAFVALLLI